MTFLGQGDGSVSRKLAIQAWRGSSIPRTQVKMPCCVLEFLVLGRERNSRKPVAPWIANLAKSVSSRPMREPVSKIQDRQLLGMRWESGPWFSHGYLCGRHLSECTSTHSPQSIPPWLSKAKLSHCWYQSGTLLLKILELRNSSF